MLDKFNKEHRKPLVPKNERVLDDALLWPLLFKLEAKEILEQEGHPPEFNMVSLVILSRKSPKRLPCWKNAKDELSWRILSNSLSFAIEGDVI